MTITSLNQDFHAMKDHPRYLERLGSVGRSMSGLLVRTADEDDVTLPPGEIGEILVKGDIVMKGYWQNSKPPKRPSAAAGFIRATSGVLTKMASSR